MTHFQRSLCCICTLAAALALAAPGAQAADKLHAANPSDIAWAFVPLSIGVDEGIFAKYGLDVDVTSFGGDQKMQQGLASGSIDVALGGGPAMAFVVKGAPVIAVAAESVRQEHLAGRAL